MMRVIYKGNVLTEGEKEEIWELLCQCDGEFYPRLSARESSSQKDLLPGAETAAGARPVTYFQEMIRQNFILAYDTVDGAEKLLGFMTFKEHYTCQALAGCGESLYITTVCVGRPYRGRGVMRALYEHMETEVPALCGCRCITTRTWSLNQAQLHELARRGYERAAVLKDDRGPGVDTVYFALRLP